MLRQVLVDALVGPGHAGIPDGPEQSLEPRPALFRVAVSRGRPPLSDTVASKAAGRAPTLLQHGL
eukprot:5732318-Alexandrium_andersonii.AAC.1